MAHLIDKDALAAEIEKKKIPFKKAIEDGNYSTYLYLRALIDFEDFINTLEVKGVDLEEEFNNFLDNIEGVPRMWHSDEQIEWGKDIARHFFELGLKLQKGE